jgi:electron transport complex protein RnfG
MKYIFKPASTLFVVAVLAVAALSIVYNLTLEPIKRQITSIQRAVKAEVLPEASDFSDNILPAKTGNIVAVFEGYTGDEIAGYEIAGYIVELSQRGYSGNINLMVGFSAHQNKITGMRVLRHTETPGLGALAVKEDFYLRFNNRALVPLGVVRANPGENDIQAITSATITTKAITSAVNEAIEWYNKTFSNKGEE